jgi:hypothetical protein
MCIGISLSHQKLFIAHLCKVPSLGSLPARVRCRVVRFLHIQPEAVHRTLQGALLEPHLLAFLLVCIAMLSIIIFEQGVVYHTIARCPARALPGSLLVCVHCHVVIDYI